MMSGRYPRRPRQTLYQNNMEHVPCPGPGRPLKKRNLQAILSSPLGLVQEKKLSTTVTRTNPHVVDGSDASPGSQVRDHMLNLHKRKRIVIEKCQDSNLPLFLSSSSPSSSNCSSTKTKSLVWSPPLASVYDIPGPIPDFDDILQDDMLFVNFFGNIPEDD